MVLEILGFIFVGFIFLLVGTTIGSEIIAGAGIIFAGLLFIFVKLEEIRELIEQRKD